MLASLVMGQDIIMCHLRRTHHHHFCDTSAEATQLKSNHEKSLDKPNIQHEGHVAKQVVYNLQNAQAVKVKTNKQN